MRMTPLEAIQDAIKKAECRASALRELLAREEALRDGLRDEYQRQKAAGTT